MLGEGPVLGAVDGGGDALGTGEGGPYGDGVGDTGDSARSGGKPWLKRTRA